MGESALSRLVGRAWGPLGAPVSIDFGIDRGPLHELGQLLARMNGFFAFNAGLQVYRAGPDGSGPELLAWNSGELWKWSYEGLADGYFFFGQDVLGTQYAIKDGAVLQWEPEDGSTHLLGDSLEAWAEWIFDEPDMNATAFLAKAWQDHFGALGHHQRLVPLRFLALGGEVDFDNLVAKDAVEAMLIRGPIATQLHDLPDGATVHIETR